MKALRFWPYAVALLLAAVAVVELVGNEVTAHLVPPPEAFAAPRRVLERECRPDDLVLVVPEWMGDGRVALGPWLKLEDQYRDDISEYRRVWLLALGERGDPKVAGLPVERRWSFDRLTLTLYGNPAYGPRLWNAMEHVAEARAEVRDGERPVACAWETRGLSAECGHERFECGRAFGEPWVCVGRTVITDMERHPRNCIWAHPTQRGPLVIAFDDVPGGARLTGHTGFRDSTALEERDKPTTLTVDVDGVEIGTTAHYVGVGWQPFVFDVPPGPPLRTVRFVVQSAFQGRRHFCFDATMRGPQ
jgi:hypothetical protein